MVHCVENYTSELQASRFPHRELLLDACVEVEVAQAADRTGAAVMEVQAQDGRTNRLPDRGWIGDNPFIFLNCSRMRALGWQPRLTIQQAVIRTIAYLEANQRLLAAR